jgi:hypothetical protein
MMEQINWPHLLVGLFGGVLVLHGILTMVSKRYYSILDKTFGLAQDLKQNGQAQSKAEQRYGASAIIIFFGIAAIAWALGLDLIL